VTEIIPRAAVLALFLGCVANGSRESADAAVGDSVSQRRAAISAPATAINDQDTASVAITGRVTDCFQSEAIPVGGIAVSGFDVRGARPLVAELTAMASFRGFADHDTSAFTKMDAMESRMRDLETRTTALARTTSAPDGSFLLKLPRTDSLLVLVFGDREDESYYYRHRIVHALNDDSVVLKMADECPDM
jgi:hypothetical protein